MKKRNSFPETLSHRPIRGLCSEPPAHCMELNPSRTAWQINKLYKKDHRMGEEWSPEKIVKYRQEYAPPIFKEIENAIKEVLAKPTTLPKSALYKVCNKVLNQFESFES